MAFPGTPVLSVENPVRLLASLSSVDMSGAPLNDGPISFYDGTGAGFSPSAAPPMIGLANRGYTPVFPQSWWAFYVYGVDQDHWSVSVSTQYIKENGQIYNDGEDIAIDGYVYKLTTSFKHVGGVLVWQAGGGAYHIGPYNTNAEITYPQGTFDILYDFVFSTSFEASMGSPYFVTKFPGSSTASPAIGYVQTIYNGDVITPTPFQFGTIIKMPGDNSAPTLYNAHQFDPDMLMPGMFAATAVGSYVYFWGVLNDNVTLRTVITRFVPSTFTVDGVGPFIQDSFQVSVDIPALQAIFDATDGSYYGAYVSVSDEGWLISFLDGSEYKLILMALDGSTYQYVDIETLDSGAAAMLAVFQAQTYPLINFPSSSNFKIHDGNMYMIAGPVDSPAFCFGPLSSSAPARRRPNVIVN